MGKGCFGNSYKLYGFRYTPVRVHICIDLRSHPFHSYHYHRKENRREMVIIIVKRKEERNDINHREGRK